jgi:hypothetical protein
LEQLLFWGQLVKMIFGCSKIKICVLCFEKKMKFLLKWASLLTSRPTRELARPAPHTRTRPRPAHALCPRSPDREQSSAAAWPPLAVDGV